MPLKAMPTVLVTDNRTIRLNIAIERVSAFTISIIKQALTVWGDSKN